MDNRNPGIGGVSGSENLIHGHTCESKDILTIGKANSAKSEVCNILAGKIPSSKDLFGGYIRDKDNKESMDQIICSDFFYAGNISRPITLIDTPEFDRKEEEADSQYMKSLEKVKDRKQVHQALIVLNGTGPRLEASIKRMLQIFETTFTSDIWENTAIVFTHLPMNKKEVRRRRKNKADDKFASDYVKDIKKLQGIPEKVQLKTFFIDASYDKTDEDEKREFEKSLEDLWKTIITNKKFEFTAANRS